MNNPKISVIMPNYNAGRFIAEAIESILGQTFQDFEFIIIDDGSTDDSWGIIQNYARKDARIIALKNETNLKICETLNRGLKIAKGGYIARMDSDDVALPERLEIQHQFMEKIENQAIGACGTFCLVIDESGKVLRKKEFPVENEQIKNAFWFRNPIQHSSAIIRKECFDAMGLYDENFVLVEDYDLWMRIGQKFKLHNIPEDCLKYRISGLNTILKKQRKILRAVVRLRLKAIREYGYEISIKGRISLVITWLMQFLPSRFVLFIFSLSIRNAKK